MKPGTTRKKFVSLYLRKSENLCRLPEIFEAPSRAQPVTQTSLTGTKASRSSQLDIPLRGQRKFSEVIGSWS